MSRKCTINAVCKAQSKQDLHIDFLGLLLCGREIGKFAEKRLVVRALCAAAERESRLGG